MGVNGTSTTDAELLESMAERDASALRELFENPIVDPVELTSVTSSAL
jgi:hypothetical protein